ncbi:MAG: anaerobic ribonucleoside-triphosphate reductase, partial [Aeromonadales bacterium]|nr:anaerobic ribonucleoside-triphosphate reductase [Aeromonadales bacterium]
MIRFIVKRDGRKVAFNEQKISNAIRKALISVHPDDGATPDDEELVKKLTAMVVDAIEKDQPETPTVERTQDYIEKAMIKEGLADEAKNFILYRQRRTNARNYNAELTKIYRDLTSKSTADMDLKRENANIDANAPMGLMLRFGSEGSKDYVRRYVLRPEHALAHSRGDIHIHDLDFYMLTINCCQIGLKQLFKRGFSTGHGFLREPQTIQSAAALCCIAIQSNQNDMHGGQSIPMFE